MYEPLVELEKLEQERTALLHQVSELGDFRRGSITTTSGTCGTPTCHCHRRNDPGHGPNFRLTFKVNGKTVTESISDQAVLRKVRKEVTEYHHFRDLSQSLVEVNEKICRLRPSEELPEMSRDKKNGRGHPAGSHPRSRPLGSRHSCRATQDRTNRFGSLRGGCADGHASRWRKYFNRVAAILRSAA